MPHQCTNCSRVFADGSKQMLSGCPDCGGNKFQFRPGGSTDDVERDTGERDRSGGPDRSLSDRVSDAGAAVRDAVSDRSGGTAPADQHSERDGPSTTADATTETDSTTEPDPATVAETGDADGPAASNASAPSESASDTGTGASTGAASDDDIVVADESYGENESTPEPSNERPNDGSEDRAQATARSDVVTPDEIEAAGGTTTTSPPDSDGRVIEPTETDRPSLDELREELNDQFESIKVINPGQYELNLMELYDRNEYIISLQEDGRYVIEVPDAWRDD